MSEQVDNTYSLNLAVDYASKWGLDKAIREIGTNAIDTTPFDYEIYIDWDTLVIRNGAALDKGEYPIVLDRENWIMGVSEKSNSDAVGEHGEGLKVGITVLLRHGFVDISIRSGWYMFRPFIKPMSFGDNRNRKSNSTRSVVWVKEELQDSFYDGTLIKVKNFDADVDISNIFLHPEDLRIIYQDGSKMLLNEEVSNIWSGRTHICTAESVFGTQSRFGYCFRPQDIELDRDRTSPDLYQVRMAMTRLWGDVEDTEFWIGLWSAVQAGKAESRIYWEYITLTEDALIASRQAFEGLYGKNAVIFTDLEYSNMLEREGGFNIVTFGETLSTWLIQEYDLQSDVEVVHSQDSEVFPEITQKLDNKLTKDQAINLRMIQRRTNLLADYLNQVSFTWGVKAGNPDVDSEGEMVVDLVVNNELSLIGKSVLDDREETFKVWVKHVLQRYWGKKVNDFGSSHSMMELTVLIAMKKI